MILKRALQGHHRPLVNTYYAIGKFSRRQFDDIFWVKLENYFKMSSAEFFTQHAMRKNYENTPIQIY